MSLRHRLGYFVKQLRRHRAQEELAAEMRTHLEMDIEENLRQGLSPEDARNEARRAFGNLDRLREESHETSGFGSLDAWMQDVKTGVRVLRRSRGFAVAALVSLALGIGANTVIFSLLDVVLLRTLPVTAPEELVIVGDPTAVGARWSGDWTGEVHPYPVYEKLRDRNEVFSGLLASGAVGRLDVRLGRGEVPMELRARTRAVTGNYFSVLGVRAALGTVLTSADDVSPGAHPVAVVSHGFWKRTLGGNAGTVGQTLELNGTEFTIVGVTHEGFFGEVIGFPTDIWIPMMMQAAVMPGRDWLASTEHSWLQIIGRLAPGSTLDEARAQLNVLFAQLLREDINEHLSENDAKDALERGLEVSSGSAGMTAMRHRYAEQLFILMGVVGLVLLIACANLANLLLSRAPARYREIGLRMALGASRARLVRQLLVETLLLAFGGGALGLVLTQGGTAALAGALSSSVSLAELGPSPRVFAFALALSVATGLAFGLIPALRTTRVDLSPALKTSSDRFAASRLRAFGLGQAVVVSQVAVSLLLLIGAGLFIRTLRNLESRDLGYDRGNLFLVNVDPIGAGYEGSAVARVCREILERLETIPGVTSATFSENGLFSGTESAYDVVAEGFAPDTDEDTGARFDQVGPRYFTNVGIPLLRGRDFTSEDRENAPHVVIINETMARFYFGDENPIGKRLSALTGDPLRWNAEIVGVAADARDHYLRDESWRRFYVPYYQRIFTPTVAHFEVRAPAELPGIADRIRDGVRAVDPDLPLRDLSTLDVLIGRELRSERQIAHLSSAFGGLALALASIGLYGVMSYNVARRTSEIGIRMALGARRQNVRWTVLKETLQLVALGTAIGIPLAIGASRLVSSQLFGIAATDPVTMGASVAILSVITVAAGYLPARRASNVDPIVALRHE